MLSLLGPRFLPWLGNQDPESHGVWPKKKLIMVTIDWVIKTWISEMRDSNDIGNRRVKSEILWYRVPVLP